MGEWNRSTSITYWQIIAVLNWRLESLHFTFCFLYSVEQLGQTRCVHISIADHSFYCPFFQKIKDLFRTWPPISKVWGWESIGLGININGSQHNVFIWSEIQTWMGENRAHNQSVALKEKKTLQILSKPDLNLCDVLMQARREMMILSCLLSLSLSQKYLIPKINDLKFINSSCDCSTLLV